MAATGWRYLAAYVLFWALPYSLIDLFIPESSGAYFVMSFVGSGLAFALLITLLRRFDLLESGARTGIISFFGLSILHSLAVFLGVLMFVLPGLYLLLRWLAAFARLLSSDEGIPAALGWSWRKTEGHVAALGLAFLAPGLLWLAGFGALFATDMVLVFFPNAPWETLYTASAVVGNVTIAVSLAWYTVLGVATYAVLRDPAGEDAGTFE